MTTALVEQTVVFLSTSTSIDVNAILADSRVQNWFTNSQGADGLVSVADFEHYNGNGTYTSNPLARIDVIVSAAFASSMLLDIPGLRTSFPQFTIATWGSNVAFGT